MLYKRIKPVYFIVVFLVFSVGLGLLFINKQYNYFHSSELTFIVGIIALSISIFSIGIADSTYKKMNLTIKAWTAHQEIQISGRLRMVVKIYNQTGVSLKELKLNVRVPSKIYVQMAETDKYLVNSYGDSKIFNFDYTYYLGKGNTDNIGTYEFTIKHIDWEKDNIWFTITAHDFETETYSIPISKKSFLWSQLKAILFY